MKTYLLLGLAFFTLSSFALEVDKRFVARVMAVSDSKKTLLIDKGHEVGLREGDHAKLSLPSGMVARGIIVKISPSRSVWSIYRFTRKEKIQKDVVFTFKISPAVRLSTDETRALGILGKRMNKKSEKIDFTVEGEKFKKEQKKLKNDFIRKDKIISQYDTVDYSSLDESPKKNPRDPDVDWNGVDGKNDLVDFDSGLDYSNLK
jgi:hypothetical protein